MKKITNRSIEEVIIVEASDALGLKIEEIHNDTVLYGKNSPIDSLDLVSLVISVEQSIEENFDAQITIADDRAMSQKSGPFRTVGSLVSYVGSLLKELDSANDR